jgi:hypothetical protein
MRASSRSIICSRPEFCRSSSPLITIGTAACRSEKRAALMTSCAATGSRS